MGENSVMQLMLTDIRFVMYMIISSSMKDRLLQHW